VRDASAGAGINDSRDPRGPARVIASITDIMRIINCRLVNYFIISSGVRSRGTRARSADPRASITPAVPQNLRGGSAAGAQRVPKFAHRSRGLPNARRPVEIREFSDRASTEGEGGGERALDRVIS